MILHDLALADPEHPALIHGDGIISRGRLDAWSDAIADHLAAAGVLAGSIVALQFETSPTLIATAVGVLKLGAAYSVMDQEWSVQRLRRIDEVLGGAFSVAGPGRVSGCFRHEIELPVFDEPFVFADSAREAAPVEGGDVATIFFTSGSTGEPKAVLSTHDATVRLFVGEQRLAYFDDQTVMPHLGSSAWDALPFEVWGPLLNGGVSVLRKHRALAPEELRREITDRGVNSVFFTTSLFHVLVDEDASAFDDLRVVYVGGEELSSAHVARFLARHPGIPLFNGYGPAESTCFALVHRVTSDDTRGAIPLGRPVPRTGVHILDGERECGPDEVGELCVSGDGVSPGYLGDEVSTAAKFVQVLIGGRRLRIYRTGDYGAKTADGVFTFAGRRDRELKIRGNRIDAGQIERTASAFDGVAQCAVVPLLGPSRRPESIALAVVPAGNHFDEGSLKNTLRNSLPPGWAPDIVVRLTAFPLTGNGKLDTVALHAAAAKVMSAHGDSDASDPVGAAFAEVLGGAHVDPEASLFDLGGTSLSAVRLCRALSRVTGLSVPASVVISHPSVSMMRAWIAEQPVTVPPVSADAAGPAASSPLTGMQSAFLFQHLDGNDAQNHAQLAWRVSGPLDVDRFAEALQDVQHRHSYLQGRYAFADRATWNRAERPITIEYLEAPTEESALPLLQSTLDTPFSLFEGNVWRAVLCRLKEREQHLLGVSVHHIAFDGWSVRILVEDVAEAYRARCAGCEPRFAHAATVPSAVYAETERVRSLAKLAKQREYWATELAGIPAGPAPWITPTLCADSGVKRIDVPLTAAEADLVGRRAIGSGLLARFIAALGETLVDVTGAEDVTIGIPISQRSTPALQDTVACLINMMCVRLRTDGAGDATAHAAGAVQAALRNSDLSIAEVARAAGQTGQTLYQVIAAVQDSPAAQLQLGDCAVDPIDLPYQHLAAPLFVELIAEDGVASGVQVAYDSALVTASTAGRVSAGVIARLLDTEGTAHGSEG
ncbi:AMP-binding protein [Catenulispora sp. GAS73]|uniref:AMP-binding protein n=1 Tax=Catenulispora sp. GAS73 TaxID=3156269 RepID=UPI003511A15D